MEDISPAARDAYDAIRAAADGMTPESIPMPNRKGGARAAVLGELKTAGLIRFEGGRYLTATSTKGDDA